MTIGRAFAALRAHGLAFPEAEEDFPWGHSALKVRGSKAALVDSSDSANGRSDNAASVGLSPCWVRMNSDRPSACSRPAASSIGTMIRSGRDRAKG